MADDDAAAASEEAPADNSDSTALRPVFLGNLIPGYDPKDVEEIFELPRQPVGGNYQPIAVDRLDLKRGYCFVFLKDVASQQHKETAQRFVSDINGMAVPKVSNALRSEFARGDGRVKKKEDERKKDIRPSETLFVVNFHEETTSREDLKMLFEPHGELVRIDMKRNYAFVQFRTVEQATRAREITNGGKLDQSILTVEFVARQRSRGRDRGRREADRGRDDYRRPPPDYYHRESRGRGDYYDRRPSYRDYRDRSPPDYRRRSRSRSRSPPRYSRSSRSPDDYRYGRDYGRPTDDDRGRRTRSPDYDRYDRRSRGSPDRDDRRGY